MQSYTDTANNNTENVPLLCICKQIGNKKLLIRLQYIYIWICMYTQMLKKTDD